VKLFSTWFNANKLSLNLDETCYNVLGTTEADKTNIRIKIYDLTVYHVDSSN